DLPGRYDFFPLFSKANTEFAKTEFTLRRRFMLQMQEETQNNLEYILKEEISVYKSLLLLESNKKDSILQSKGKDLEAATKQISHLLSIAVEIESRRKNAMSKVFTEKKISPKSESITLTDFLENLEEEEKPKYISLADDLRKVVTDLREKVEVNEKLLKAKQEIFQLSMEALKVASAGVQEVGYDGYDSGLNTSKPRTNVVINTKA
ncbi:MAG TPA: flagellar export chaperone FlgN, partial [Leptospiraceae bacterium]|nr:flagellar export chaperone FlgN [Leptospiraceae bacterium]